MRHFLPSLDRSQLSANWRAGINATAIGLPQEINYGLLTFAPLGASCAGLGIATAIYTSIVAVIVSLMLGAGTGRIVGPRPTLCIIMAAFFSTLLQKSAFPLDTLFLLAAITVAVAGFFLLIASQLGLGRLINYVPFTVLSGYTNGVAAMLLLFALPIALGSTNGTAGFEWLNRIQPAALLVTVVTVWFSRYPFRIGCLKSIPPILQALFLAWLLHGILTRVGNYPAGPVLAELVAVLPSPSVLIHQWSLPNLSTDLLILICKFAMVIALTAAIETLATGAAVDMQQGERTSGDRVLRWLGGTMLCVAPLGIPVAGSLGRSMALFSAGQVIRLSQWCYVALMFCLAFFAYPVVALLPQAAIAGVLIVVAQNMVGNNLQLSIAEIRNARDYVERRRSVADFLVMTLVTLLTISEGFITGLAVGLVCAMALFIRDQSRSVIRRIQYGNVRHSLKQRSPAARTVQNEHGHEIVLLELQGVLFFGSFERLAEQLDCLIGKAKVIIIDLQHVIDVDMTATRMLGQSATRLAESGCTLILAQIRPDTKLRDAFETRRLADDIPMEHWFSDIDLALEFAEQCMLAGYEVVDSSLCSCSLEASDLAAGLSQGQMNYLKSFLVPRQLASGEILFRQGDKGCSLFIVLRGGVNIQLPHLNNQGKRLVAFGAGAVVGEMALITGAPRSADAITEGDTELLELTEQQIALMQESNPEIVSALLRTIAVILADRLRGTTIRLRDLAES